MEELNIYRRFCSYVNEKIFSDDMKGENVAFVVDEFFITEFCSRYNTSKKVLLSAVNRNMYASLKDHLHIKGQLAIQLYAASVRENSGGLSESNFRERLREVLGLYDVSLVDDWMVLYQDRFWESLYLWCEQEGFLIDKCSRKVGKNRYVQYPLLQAERLFTNQDLKHIAYAFVEAGLEPGEDICQKDFFKVVTSGRISRCILTSHGRTVIGNSRENANQQIFNFYLRWDGSYLDPYHTSSSKTKDKAKPITSLYLSLDNQCIDIRDSKYSLVARIGFENLSVSMICSFYNFKRKGRILFKKNDIYDGVWEETRYIEGNDEGLLLIFNKEFCSSNGIERTLHIEYQDSKISIYRTKRQYATYEYYTDKKYFSLEGGLKIGRMQYLYGAAPYLHIDKPTKYWIDGKTYENKEEDCNIHLGELARGMHHLKFPNHQLIDFEFCDAPVTIPEWNETYSLWEINRKEALWESSKTEGKFCGLDFSSIKTPEHLENRSSILKRWCKLQNSQQKNKKEKNIALIMLQNQK